MRTAGMGERISGLGRPRCTASGTAQVPDISNKVGDTTQMQCMAACACEGNSQRQTGQASVEGQAGGDGASLLNSQGGVEGTAAGGGHVR